MFFRNLIFLFHLVLYSVNAFSQDLEFNNISEQLKLPSRECYGIIQDSRGYFWVSTEMGLVKFCKSSSLLFDNKNGIDENAVYYLNENQKKEIEVITAGNRFLRIRNNKVIETSFSRKILQFIKREDTQYNENTFSLIYFLMRNDKNDLFFITQRATYFLKNKKGKFGLLVNKNKSINDAKPIDLIIESKSAYLIKHLDVRPIKKFLLKQGKYVFRVIKDSKQKLITVPINNNTHVDWRIRCYKQGNKTYLNIHNNIVIVDDNLNYKIITFPSVVISIYANKKFGLWVGTTGNGVFYFPDINKTNLYKKALSGMSVSSTFIDSENNIWCTTLEQGVFVAKSSNFEKNNELASENSKVTLLKGIENKLYISSKVDELSVFDENKFQTFKLMEVGSIEITDFIAFRGKKYISTKGYLAELTGNYKLKYKFNDSEHLNNVLTYQLDTSRENLYALGIAFVFKLKNEKLVPVSQKLKYKASCFKIINDNQAYVGTSKGLYKVGLNNSMQKKIKGIKTKVSKILKINYNTYLVTTLGNGLFLLKNEILFPIILKEKIYQMTDVVEYEPNHFFIATPKGILDIHKSKSYFFSHLINSADGLMLDYVNHLTCFNGFIYFSGYNGIMRFNPRKNLKNIIKPNFYINQVFVNNILVNKEKLLLNHNENNLRFVLDIIQFRTGKNEGVYYKLKGVNKEYQLSLSNVITFQNLPPGSYKLSVYVKNSDGIRSSIKSISFNIEFPIWRKFWFIFLIVSLVIGLTFSIVNIFFQRVKRREKEKTELYRLVEESKLTALQAQMNPHFIFNAINSIQHFILNRNELEAYSYLSKFSKLIRIVLNNVGSHNHTLREELDLLNLYIELEKMRFEKSFVFNVFIDENVEVDEVYIPVLLIQPYIENAIWHGLMPMTGEIKPSIELIITSNNKYLIIEIIDNGIGRKKSLQMKENNVHYSKGMSLTKQRIEVMGKMAHQNKVSVIVTDLEDQRGSANGTNVKLILPYSLEK